MGHLERIESVYRAHHEARRPQDFVFCGPERRALFREWVGEGGRVLDVGRPPEPDPTHLHLFSPDDVRGMLGAFDQVQLRFVAGRLTPLHPRLFANDICFRARKPPR
jgi:hypothetical protein